MIIHNDPKAVAWLEQQFEEIYDKILTSAQYFNLRYPNASSSENWHFACHVVLLDELKITQVTQYMIMLKDDDLS